MYSLSPSFSISLSLSSPFLPSDLPNASKCEIRLNQFLIKKFTTSQHHSLYRKKQKVFSWLVCLIHCKIVTDTLTQGYETKLAQISSKIHKMS